MSDDLSGGVAAPAEITAPAPETDVSAPPNPISTEPLPEPEVKEEPKVEAKEPDKKVPTAREALKAAADKIEKQEAKPEDAKPAEKPEAKRDPETGKFATKEDPAEKAKEALPEPKAPEQAEKPSGDTKEPPARFSPEAKAAWQAAPDQVKAEVHRAIRELEQGHEKYKADASAFHEVREFDTLAKQHGTSIKAALTNYTNLERTLTQDPLRGLQAVCDYAGINIREVAAHIMGQTPDQQTSQRDAENRQLRQELADLKRQVGSVTETIQTEKQGAILSTVQEFAAKNPRFEELAPDIELLLTSGKTTDLGEAYKLAERMNPVPLEPKPAVTQPAPDLTAQTLKGSKSVSGGPGPGSDPEASTPSSSIKDALRKAAAKAG